MNTIDLTELFLEKQKHRPIKMGRYHISRLWGLLNGYTTPEEYLKGEIVDFQSALRMRMGTLKHDLIQELLDGWEIEQKKEYKHKDFILVGKCDAINKTDILEIKTSDKIINTSKRWHDWQVRMYLSMFKRENGIIVQPVVQRNKLLLREIGKIRRNDKWFKLELAKIETLHRRLKEII